VFHRAAFRTTLPLLLLPACLASNGWVSLRTRNFQLFTQSDEKSGREAIKLFEEVRLAFTETLGLKLPGDKPITIISFRDEKAIALYLPRPTVLAYTLTMPDRDYIVMRELAATNYYHALHEFTHVMIAQAGLKLPLWLNEGFAEIYGTLTPIGHKIRVGRIIPGRLQNAQSALLDLHDILTATFSSKLYNETDRVGIFYAESWALVHMLKFSDGYSSRFDRVLDAIGRGESSEDALQRVYGKTLRQILFDLQNYVHGSSFREGVIKARLDRTVPQPQLEPVDPVEMGVLLASIQARGPARPLAIKALGELSAANPQRREPVETLAWLELNGPEPSSALVPFRKALERGTRDANLCFQFAVKLHELIPETDYVAALRRAVEIDPGFSQAQEQLAAYAYLKRDYPETLARLHAIKKLERANAFAYWHMLSMAALQTGNLPEAKSAAVKAAQYSATSEQKQLIEALQRRLESR
jgi:hypothetical protein